MSNETVKPPIGVKPQWLLAEERLKDLLSATIRYAYANILPPEEWATEIGHIIQHLLTNGRDITISAIKDNK